jgi:transposase
MLQMDAVAVVRHRVLVEGASVREVARALGIARNTARRYLRGAPVGVRKTTARERPAMERAQARMEALLKEAPRWTGGKQRLTATQLHRLLRAEGIQVGVTLVKEYVHEWKRRRAEVFVPLVYKPGDLGEVDFFEVLVELAGKRVKAWMFLLRAMYSGRDFAWLFPRQDQTCFLEGHVRAFEHLGAVLNRLAYDNLKAAVAKLLTGSERVLAARFAALTNHYLFEASFCRPGTGHDKGGVEARGKGIRLQHLVPIPAGDSLESISGALLARLDAQAADRRDIDGRSVLDRFADEQQRMLPLPGVPYQAAETRLHVSVTGSAQVNLGGAKYSVWSTWSRLAVTARLGVDTVELVGPDGRTVRHPRMRFGTRSIDYRHYLPELGRKPQALRQVAGELVQALGPVYARAWRHLVDEHGPKQAARVFAQVVQAVEEHGAEALAPRVELALAQGEPLQLALRPTAPAVSLGEEAMPPSVRGVVIETAQMADYDALLGGVA